MDRLNDDDQSAELSAEKALRYRESQVMFGIRNVWREQLGAPSLFSSHDRIVDCLIADGIWEELDLVELFQEFEEYFEFETPESEWCDLFGLPASGQAPPEGGPKPSPTFGDLARFIAARAPAIATFAPVCVFGQMCESAGVFKGLTAVAHRTLDARTRFSPKTKIRSVLHASALEEFWDRVHWMTEGAIPPLASFWRNVVILAVACASLAILIGGAASIRFSNPPVLVATAIAGFTLCSAAYAYRRFVSPLPQGVRTFRDLTLAIVQARRTAPAGA